MRNATAGRSTSLTATTSGTFSATADVTTEPTLSPTLKTCATSLLAERWRAPAQFRRLE